MQDLLKQFVDSVETGQPVVYCRLVETRGSTPQKPGALMLVFADGTQAGTLGGGCVEAEVKRHALGLLDQQTPALLRFDLDHDYGWDDGLICGGRMHVMMEPFGADAASDGRLKYFRELLGLTRVGRGGTEVVHFDTAHAATDAKSQQTACWLFDHVGELLQSLPTVDQAPLPADIANRLQPLSTRPRPYADRGYAFLPWLPRCRLIIVGGGHVGQAVGELAAQLDFQVWVVDDRESYVSVDRFPSAHRRVSGPLPEVLPRLEVTPNTYCLIVTRGHNHDQEALYYLADRGARYVGMIGSRRKIKLILDNLTEEGISTAALDKVYAPIGIDIGSQTVAEIAVSVAAELVSHRNRGGIIPGRTVNHTVAH